MVDCTAQLTPYEAYQKKLLKRISDPALLYPPFAEIIGELALAITQHQMPFKIYETYRTPARQKKLISLGLSKVRNSLDSKHVHGLAIDVMLDYKAVRSLKKNKLSKLTDSDINKKTSKYSDDFGVVYNLGVNEIATKSHRPRTLVEDGVVLEFWNYLGKLIRRQFPNLVWGGTFNLTEGQLIGTDPPHIEYLGADEIMQQRRAIMVLKGRGNPGLEGVKI